MEGDFHGEQSREVRAHTGTEIHTHNTSSLPVLKDIYVAINRQNIQSYTGILCHIFPEETKGRECSNLAGGGRDSINNLTVGNNSRTLKIFNCSVKMNSILL